MSSALAVMKGDQSPPTSSVMASAVMKGDPPPTSSSVVKTGDDRVYAVFENLNSNLGCEYLIYKLDDSVDEQKPILTLNSADYNNLGYYMAVFSLGRFVYFCGGFVTSNMITCYKKDAYVLDTNSSKCLGIKPMNNPVRDPLVFGPIGGDKFYVINRVLAESVFSFEMLNTSTNEWKSLPTLDYCGLKLRHPAFSHWDHSKVEEFLTINAYAVCDSNIYISTPEALFVYSTNDDTWSVSGKPRLFRYESNLPFLGQAHPMSGNNFLAAASLKLRNWPKTVRNYYMPAALLEVYKSLDNVFQRSGEFVHLGEHLKETPPLKRSTRKIYSDNYMPRFYVVRTGVVSFSVVLRKKGGMKLFDITTCDLSLTEDDKVKVTNSNTYQVFGDKFNTELRHLFSVA